MVSRLMINIQNSALFETVNKSLTDADFSTFIAYEREGLDDHQSLPVYSTGTEANRCGMESSDSPSLEPVWHR